MSRPLLDYFNSRCSYLWATTYTFDLVGFDEFIFPRLGDPPRNVNVFADANQLVRRWQLWEEESRRSTRANRDYLLIPVQGFGGAFHPKSYLLGNDAEARLMVGSGNLGWTGLVEGREVFCDFCSKTETGTAAIASWLVWFERVLQHVGDLTSIERWSHFRSMMPYADTTIGESPLLHNLDEPILSQFLERIPNNVDELHVLAPFFDSNLSALTQLITKTDPSSLLIYLPEGVSVGGELLLEVTADIPTQFLQFDPRDFVHAKLLGVVAGDIGVILSGSANCSSPALLKSASTGNVELAVIAESTAETVRRCFLPPGSTCSPATDETVRQLTFRDDHFPTVSWPLALANAVLREDRRVLVQYDPEESAPLQLCSHTFQLPLHAGETMAPLPADDASILVWLAASENGERLSNAVPLQDLKRLKANLRVVVDDENRPSELDPLDLSTEIGVFLQDLNHSFIFDVSEITNAVRGGEDAATDDAGAEGTSDIWESLQRDLIKRDHRIARYERGLPYSNGLEWTGDYDVLGLLQAMLHRVPAPSSEIGPTEDGGNSKTGAGKPKIDIRVGNLLERWSLAINDPRLLWIAPDAGVKNYIALIGAIGQCWRMGWVKPTRLREIVRTLLTGFVGTRASIGYLTRLNDEQLEEAKQVLGCEAVEVAAAFVYASLPPNGDWRKTVYEWQPVLNRGLDLGIISAGSGTIELCRDLLMVSESSVTPANLVNLTVEKVQEHLELLANFIDDKHWCKLQEQELGLGGLAFVLGSGINPKFELVVTLERPVDLLAEPKIVSLVARALQYKKKGSLVLDAENPIPGDSSDRLSLQLGDQAFARIRDEVLSSPREVSMEDLEFVQQLGRGFEAIFESGYVSSSAA